MPIQPCLAQVGDFIVVHHVPRNPDWLGRVFCVEVARPGLSTANFNLFDPFFGCPPEDSQTEMFYHYVAAKHVGRILARDAECIRDECDFLFLEKRGREQWGRWLVPCDRREFISKSKLWEIWSKTGCVPAVTPPAFETVSGGIIGGCGGDPECCFPDCD